MQKKTGISLIVLVITIIVMIILAAAIIISLNNTGIISNANTAKTKTDDKQIREAIEVAKLNLNFEGGINESNLQNELQKSLGVDVEVINNMDKSYTIKVKDMYYTLEEDETVVSGIYDKWDKTSTEPTQTTNEIHIYKASELKWVQEEVEKGNLFENYKIYLENNLDFGARENTGTTLDEKWKTTSNKEYKWTPIAKEKGKELKAEFDGKEHIIKGIYVEETTNFNGIFGGSQATIKNLTIKNSYIEGAACTAGIVGVGRKGCVVSNCHNINTTVVLISGNNHTVAGVVGQSDEDVTNCTNSGDIIAYGKSSSSNSQAAGVLGNGASKSRVIDCKNTGNVNAVGGNVGGIVSCMTTVNTDEEYSIINCVNYGNIKGDHKVGGICGLYYGTITDCINNGNITSEKWCGGIIGNLVYGSNLANCANYGNVTSVEEYTGGIVGRALNDSTTNKTNTTIKNSFNIGKVTGKTNVGGIVGIVEGTDGGSTINNCYNKGIVTGKSALGSIIGSMQSNIDVNTISELYYLNTLSLKAINNVNYLDKNVTSTTKNINSFEEFKKWIMQIK